MSLQIQDPALEARIHEQREKMGSHSIEEVLAILLETKEEQDRWLLEIKGSIDDEIQIGLDELDRGEGVFEDELVAHMASLKSQAE